MVSLPKETRRMVRTRFAPSPTGYLHIGGVRTALYNWLFARKHHGQFILRIDDTDAGRNVAEALAPILHGFRWLGIDWDEGAEMGGPCGPYYQSQKLACYQTVVRQLLDQGVAYWDFTPADEARAEREAAEKQKRLPNYRGQWMAQTDEERRSFESRGDKAVVRLKMPREGFCTFFDHIRGDMKVEWASEQDHVIQRADGSCLYNLASVVDDQDMQITHVIRAEEHLSNTPRQIFMIDALGYPRPEYAHLPFVAAPGSQQKLSKRKLADYLKNPDFKKVHERATAIANQIGLQTSAETFNPVIVDFYEQVGYLPDAIVNYLLLLGWSLDDKTEMFTRQQMIDDFTLERVNKSPASFDVKKLGAFQERYMNALPIDEKLSMVMPYLERARLVSNPPPLDTIRQLVQAAGERIKISGDILDYADFFTADEQLPIDDKVFDKRIRKPVGARDLLRDCRQALADAPAFDPASLEKLVTDFVQARGIDLGDIVHALRVAVTGKAVGFGLYEALAILGQPRCLARIDRALQRT
jgi:glutamyl-tRNA synthetase